MAKSELSNMQIIDYQSVHFQRWKEINEAWITRAYFMEEIDHLHCSQPEASILSNGGFILLAQMGGEIAGTAGLIKDDEETYELIKMAVDERFRGLRIGVKLCEAAIEKARDAGAKLLYLFSNTKGSATAIQIYRDLGFIEVPLDRQDFARADIRMEMRFSADNSFINTLRK
ncbi:MAG: GNAT family N-acetyltransferase [Saprospiraceae bacterium]|nr:GNAT family N-acetyltransferase [Saprospiraceae bacterium]